MTLIQSCIRYPVSTAVGVLLLTLFGGIALSQLPVQLTPTINRPTLAVLTEWPGASPYEVEREIIKKQEEQLKSIEGLVSMRSESYDGQGVVILQFQLGTNKEGAMVKVSNRLTQVESYPQEVLQPVISTDDDLANGMAYFALMASGPDGFKGDITTLRDFVEDFVKPELERAPGVSRVGLYGGREQEIHVVFDPAKLALRGLTLSELAEALDRENRNFSGGSFDEGKRRYVVRTMGEYQSVEDIENVVVAIRDDVPVYLRDVAHAELNYRKISAIALRQEQVMLFMVVIPEPGANVLEIVEEVNKRREQLNAQVLEPRGLHLVRDWDESRFITNAIRLVSNSLLMGGVLAVLVLLLVLRSPRSTLVIAVSVPISLIGTFLVMQLLGRTLNLISLAGLAFATGMVMDNAIVVLENIFRHRQNGESAQDAAYRGAKEVWGATLASTLTTVAVFLPVTLIDDELGQLLADIAIAVCCAVSLSLLVAITVVPSLSAVLLRGAAPAVKKNPTPFAFTTAVTSVVRRINQSITRQLAVVLAFLLGTLSLGWLLMPETEYLPRADTDWVDVYISPPPGYSVEELISINQVFTEELESMVVPFEQRSDDLPGGGIGDYNFSAFRGTLYLGLSSHGLTGAPELVAEIDRAASKVPGAWHFVDPWNIFAGVGSEQSNIDLLVLGPELEEQMALASKVLERVNEVMPEGQAYPIPDLDLGNPELRVFIDRLRAGELGISNRDLGFSVSALVDGAKASTYRHEGKEIDIKLVAQRGFGHRTHELEQIPIATPDGRWVNLGSIAKISLEQGPTQINHREQRRAIAIRTAPPQDMSTEAAIKLLETSVLQPLRESGEITLPYSVEITGSADSMARASATLLSTFILALVISYLLMSALFENFLYPLVIMLSVPLAAFGGVLGLAIMNWLGIYQPLDTLTMLGFVILAGTVVNSAILIVHRTLQQIREGGLAMDEAIHSAVQSRIRPIFLTVSTSSLSVLPLVLAPGAGAEVYRGLGAVVIGGLLVSTLFTLILIPTLLSLVLSVQSSIRKPAGG
jgi:hydrophobic/amphiphilic exporter-1 (mainly G- bacteria), HAE1 family